MLISKTMIQSVLVVLMTGTNLPSPIATHAPSGFGLAGCQLILLQDTRPMEEIACEPLDCPWLYERKTAKAEVQIWTQLWFRNSILAYDSFVFKLITVPLHNDAAYWYPCASSP